jgi:hypothetical protein
MEINFEAVNQIFGRHQIEIKNLESPTGSFGKNIFLINQEFLFTGFNQSNEFGTG